MATVTAEVKIEPAAVTVVDLVREAQKWTQKGTGSSPGAPGLSLKTINIRVFHPSFQELIGDSCKFSLISESFGNPSRNPFFYKGCAYLLDVDELYTTSDLLQSTASSRLPTILISKLSFRRSIDVVEPDLADLESEESPPAGSPTTSSPVVGVEWMKLRPPPSMPMPSGAIPYKKGVLFCSQGTLHDPASGGLFYMPRAHRPIPLVTGYFGKPFNSVQHVVEGATDGALWFTDSAAGHERDIRPHPSLPSHVYWFQPRTGELRVVADGLARPSGIALSPREDVLYVSDTEAARPGNSKASTSSATIYAYDILKSSGPGQATFLANKRVFSFAFSGVPASLLCDDDDDGAGGNVYAACADGVEVWNAAGTALGVIDIPGGCSSLCFGRRGELFVCGGQNLWRIQLERNVCGSRRE
ncbi:hypothetical protein F5Y17DRAFT_291755 [Xylariaceae sp. FL0594]|nr:hypothetical protein F5Y17DRAFT_291755 [Xylariaceae sp. FL0594]